MQIQHLKVQNIFLKVVFRLREVTPMVQGAGQQQMLVKSGSQARPVSQEIAAFSMPKPKVTTIH